MSWGEFSAKSRRLAILQILERQPRYAANDGVLAEGLAALGHSAGLERTQSDLAWLEGHKLVTLRSLQDEEHAVVIATLSARGIDVARGRLAAPRRGAIAPALESRVAAHHD